MEYKTTGDRKIFKEASTAIQGPGGKHNLYFVFVRKETSNTQLFSLGWINFDR
jgi:cytochrome c